MVLSHCLELLLLQVRTLLKQVQVAVLAVQSPSRRPQHLLVSVESLPTVALLSAAVLAEAQVSL